MKELSKAIDEKIRELKNNIKKRDLKSLQEDIKAEDWYMAYSECKWLALEFAYLDILTDLKQELKQKARRVRE